MSAIQAACSHLHNFPTIPNATVPVLQMFHMPTMMTILAKQAVQAIEPCITISATHTAQTTLLMLTKGFVKQLVLELRLIIMIINVLQAALHKLLIFTLMALFVQTIVETATFYTMVTIA